MKYQQLKLSDRITIEYLLEKGYSQADIARQLNVHRSTVQREVARNSYYGRYDAHLAQSSSRRRKFRGETARELLRNYPEKVTYRRRRWIHHGRYADRRTFRFRAYLPGVGYLYNFSQHFLSYGCEPEQNFCTFVAPKEDAQEEIILQEMSPPVKRVNNKHQPPVLSPVRQVQKQGEYAASRGEERPVAAYDTS